MHRQSKSKPDNVHRQKCRILQAKFNYRFSKHYILISIVLSLFLWSPIVFIISCQWTWNRYVAPWNMLIRNQSTVKLYSCSTDNKITIKIRKLIYFNTTQFWSSLLFYQYYYKSLPVKHNKIAFLNIYNSFILRKNKAQLLGIVIVLLLHVFCSILLVASSTSVSNF